MNIYKGHIIYTPTPQAFSTIENGYIAVDDKGLVIEVSKERPASYPDIPVTDFGDALLIPAMNDMHVHAPQYRNMGIAMDKELLPWLNQYTFPEESRFKDIDYAYAIYTRFIHDLWLNGTMRSVVFATSDLRSTLLLCRLFEKVGLGAAVGLVAMDRNCPKELQVPYEQFATDMAKLVEDSKEFSTVFPILTPRFIPSCSPELLKTISRFVEQMHLPVQSHLSENRAEVAWVKELEPESSCYGDAYNHYGLFGQTPTLMAHCCYTEGEELELMRRNRVMAVHCPMSNCNLGSGIAPIRTLLQNEVDVSLGSDVAGGHSLNIFRVMQYAIQMSKLRYAQSEGTVPFLTLSEAFYMATKAGGAYLFGSGSFEKGYAFDALVIDDKSLNYSDPKKGVMPYSLPQRLERFIYSGDEHTIVHRFCGGKEIYEPKL